MSRQCPACKSLDVRRSHIRGADVTPRHIFLSPYRCKSCGERFWVVSRNAYYFFGVIGGALIAGALGWHAWDLFESPPRVPRAASSAAVAAAPTGTLLPSAEVAKRAEAGDAAAEYELARAHLLGDGVAKSDQEALKWLERSSRHGNSQAQYEYAIALRDGRGTIQDYEGARHWMTTAAEGGNPQAQFDLGVMYRVGTGVGVDNVKSYIWLNLAAAQGVPGAAPLRDAVLSRLSPEEVTSAQAEARRLSETHVKRGATAP